MKILKNNIALLLLFLVAMVSCEDEMMYTGQLDNMPRMLKVDKSRISVDSEAETVVILKVSSENTSWVIRNIPSWLEVSPASGSGTLNVKVSAKERIEIGKRREATIKVESTVPTFECVREVVVSQAFKTNGFEAIDLGLPGALFWATCNLGSSNPEDYGNYYAWGETYPKSAYTMYNSSLYGSEIFEISGINAYDAARYNMGYGWSIPTIEDVKTLMANCALMAVEVNGVHGRKVTGPNGNNIFLPSCGYRSSSTNYSGGIGCYWTSTSYDDVYYAQAMLVESNSINYSPFERYYGLGIRPVYRGFVMETDSLNLSTSASETRVSIESLVPWEVECYEPWVSCETEGSSSLKITVGENASNALRHAEIVFYHSSDRRHLGTLVINQAGVFNLEYVDLGLPSGVKWANCNIGSTTPEGYGGFYAWGELETKSEYTEANYRWRGQSLGDISGNPNYDVARALWGADWRIPTLNDYNELMERCTWEWITSNDVAGYRITGPNGNSIFMPAAGECWSNESLVGRELRYWASTPYTETAYCLNADASTKGMHVGQTYVGLRIRPVFGSSSGTDEEYFSLETAGINFGNSASDYTLGVNTNIEWSAESSESWATVVKNDNSTLVVSVEENSAVSSRSASIKFRRSDNGNELGTVNVYQEGSEEYFSLEMTYFIVDASASEYPVALNTNIEWNANTSDSWLRCFEGFADWTSSNHEDGSSSMKEYTLDVSAGSVLDFDWYVSSESGYDWLTITLDGGQIVRKSGNDSGHYSMTFDAAGSHSLVVTYTKDGSGDTGEDCGKIYNIALSGSNSSYLLIAVDENTSSTSRTGIVTITRSSDGSELGTVTVVQEAIGAEFFSLETSDISFGYSASEYTLSINTNIDWYAEAPYDWLSFTKNDNASLTVSVEENASTSSRNATIVFRRNDNNEELGRVTVNQNAFEPHFALDTYSIQVACTAVQYTVNVEANVYWSVESASTWISVTKIDDSTASIIVSENEFVNRSRSGEVVFRDANGNVLATLSVTQSERELSVSHSRIELPLEGGESRAVTINAVGEYSVSSSDGWFTVNYNRADNTFTVVADANQDSADRTGTVVVALLGDPYGETKSVTIDVVQYAGDINFDLGDFDEDKEWN